MTLNEWVFEVFNAGNMVVSLRAYFFYIRS